MPDVKGETVLLLAAGWFVAAALCARRARGSARAGRGDDPGVVA
jgi:hypothetical protein